MLFSEEGAEMGLEVDMVAYLLGGCIIAGYKKTALLLSRTAMKTYFIIFAESEGFEPPDLLQSTVFKTAAFDRSANFPFAKVQHFSKPASILQRFFILFQCSYSSLL